MLGLDPKSTILNESEKRSKIDRIKAGFKDRYSEGREDARLAFYEGNEAMGLDAETTRIDTTLGTNPTFTTIRDLTETSNKEHRDARRRRGMGLSADPYEKLGQLGGTLAGDLTQDNTRSLWWLLNAAQATGNVIAEKALGMAQPALFEQKDTGISVPRYDITSDGKKVPAKLRAVEKTRANREAHDEAVKRGIINEDGSIRKGFSKKDGTFREKNVRPGDYAALMIPTGIAINAGLGLLNPLGGSGGYKAALPSEEDPTKTSNVVLEVAGKYLLGRTGGLLPYEQFKEHRPDVSEGEYRAYKAFKNSKETDLNPFDDGQVTLPFAVAKATTDGIHGPEVQFLGRSIPLTTTGIPFLGALAGGMAGVAGTFRKDKSRTRYVADGLRGGMIGLGAGSLAGVIAEEARRRAGGIAEENLGVS